MSEPKLRKTLLIKAALEFNAAVIAVATKVLADSSAKPRQVGRELSRLFEEYHQKVTMILKEDE